MVQATRFWIEDLSEEDNAARADLAEDQPDF